MAEESSTAEFAKIRNCRARANFNVCNTYSRVCRVQVDGVGEEAALILTVQSKLAVFICAHVDAKIVWKQELKQ